MILLDTHAFVWFVSDRSKLSRSALSAIKHEDDRLMISVVTAWEIALLQKKDQLTLPLPASDFIKKAIQRHDIRELALTRTTAISAVNLPDLHSDPFDRVIIAEAMQNNCTLVSKDATIATYPDIKALW